VADQLPPYVYCAFCRRHVRRNQYTWHAQIRHPQTPAPQVPPQVPPAAPATNPAKEISND